MASFGQLVADTADNSPPFHDTEELDFWIRRNVASHHEFWREHCPRFWTPPSAILAAAVPHSLDRLPNDSGIYVGIDAGQFIYVGQAASMHARMVSHWRGGRTWPSIWGIAVPQSLLDHAESLYMLALRPSENIRRPRHDERDALRRLTH